MIDIKYAEEIWFLDEKPADSLGAEREEVWVPPLPEVFDDLALVRLFIEDPAELAHVRYGRSLYVSVVVVPSKNTVIKKYFSLMASSIKINYFGSWFAQLRQKVLSLLSLQTEFNQARFCRLT